jgi:RND family efflux transporter MFP subunit
MKFGLHQVGFLGALFLLLLASCGKADKAKSARPDGPPRPVRVARAELRPMERALHVVGTLSARDEATVAAEVAGKIDESKVDFGDRVNADQVLALIDFTAYEALVRQSAANVARANASAANAAQNLKRIQDLQKDKISSASELDEAIAEDRQRRADVKAAEATDAIARLNLERSRVKAPFDGAVAQRIASAGDYVAIGTPIIKLVKTDPLRLRLDVPEREALAVRVGQSVRVTAEGDTNIFTGQIARIAPAIRDADRMLQVEADVPNNGGLRAGLFARAQIVVNERDEAVSIPPSALTTFAGLEKVVVIKEGKAAEKTVETGRRGTDWVEIVSGLGAGEAVVLDPAGIRTGQPLSIGDSAETSATGH